MKKLLVFPAVSAEAWEQVQQAEREGRPYVLAASLPRPPVGAPADAAKHWVELPSIYAPEFAGALAALVAQRDIGAVYAPVPSVHAFLRHFLAARPSSLTLVNEAPIERKVRQLGASEQLALEVIPVARAVSDGEIGLDDLAFRAVIEAAMETYGESGAEKIAAMAGIMRGAPRGDVVEIGTLMGRSAVALRLMSRSHGIGPVLTVDPWAPAESAQVDSPQTVRDDMVVQWDYERLARGFAARMFALGDAEFAHLRLPSRLAYERYQPGCELHYPPFKPTRFSGRIAVLHIDGNHDYAAVRDDWQRWAPHVVAGGWVILDDYVWAHGDGPCRLGDEVLVSQGARISRCFVLDKALFLRFEASPLAL